MTNALEVITAGSDAIQGLITGALPLVGAVVMAVLGIWMIHIAIKMIKSAIDDHEVDKQFEDSEWDDDE